MCGRRRFVLSLSVVVSTILLFRRDVRTITKLPVAVEVVGQQEDEQQQVIVNDTTKKEFLLSNTMNKTSTIPDRPAGRTMEEFTTKKRLSSQQEEEEEEEETTTTSKQQQEQKSDADDTEIEGKENLPPPPPSEDNQKEESSPPAEDEDTENNTMDDAPTISDGINDKVSPVPLSKTDNNSKNKEEDISTPYPSSSKSSASSSSSSSSSTSASTIILTHKGLQSQFVKGRANLRNKMKPLYGEYYEEIFEPNLLKNNNKTTTSSSTDTSSIGQYFHKTVYYIDNRDTDSSTSADEKNKSWNAMIRKLQIKIRQAQLRTIIMQQQQQQPVPDPPQYIWITSGDSNAAGFGNLHHQTQTYVLQDAIQEIFKSVGIDFVARHHAYRGQESGPEIALCTSSLFGTQFDSLVWDFDTEDNKDIWQRSMYAHRAAAAMAAAAAAGQQQQQQTTIPTLFIHSGGTLGKPHRDGTTFIAQRLSNDLGIMPVLLNNPLVESRVVNEIMPDCTYLSDMEVQNKMPPNVQFMRCGKNIEANSGKKGGRGTGEGHCSNFKFDLSVCRKRGDKKDWFPGWKTHAFKGYFYAMTMIELLSQAIDALGREEPLPTTDLTKAKTQVEDHIRQLFEVEQRHYNGIGSSSPLSSAAASTGFSHKYSTKNDKNNKLALWHSFLQDEEKHRKEIGSTIFNITTLFQSPSLCRTTLMPSDSRLRGIFTGDGPVPFGEGYQTGITMRSLEVIQQQQSNRAGFGNSTQLPVVTNPSEKGGCAEPGVVSTQEESFRDFYLATAGRSPSSPSWQSLTIPNSAEEEYYKDFDMNHRQGWIIMCLMKCAKCPVVDMILGNQLNNGQTQILMEVNGIPVTGFIQFMSHAGFCRALKHDGNNDEDGSDKTESMDQQLAWKTNQQGRYDIRIQLKDAFPRTPPSSLKITSFILM